MPGRQMLTSVLPTHLGEVLLTRSLKVAAVLVVAFALNRLARWMVRRLVRSLQRQQVQQRLASIRAKTPRALRSTEPLPSLRRSQRADAIGALVRNLSSVVIWLVASAWILQILGVQLGPLVAGAGFVGLAIAISAQQMVTDFLAGIAMLLEDEYGVGDVIDVGPATGEVERVGLRTTQLRAVDGTVWHVRNGEIDRVGNLSRDWRRVLLDVEVARGADLPLATRTVEHAAQELYQDEQWLGRSARWSTTGGLLACGGHHAPPGGHGARLGTRTMRPIRWHIRISRRSARSWLPRRSSTAASAITIAAASTGSATSTRSSSAPGAMSPTAATRRPPRGLVPPASQESAASPVRVSVSTVVVTSATARPVTRSAATAPA
jgi:moderate conductance mechanosensitive channel